MRFYDSALAPNPRRVRMFMAEKALTGIERREIDINALEHESDWFRALNPRARVPALALDDGRVLTESRAICVYLEHLYPEPNLMGVDGEERAFIEMWDRRIELDLFFPIAHWVRHTHPGLAVLERPQVPAWGEIAAQRAQEAVDWFERTLQAQPFAAGARFTIADITAYCALEFGRLAKFRPWTERPALAAWRETIGNRASAKA